MTLLRRFMLFDEQTNRQGRINPGSGSLISDPTFRLVGPQFIGSTIDTSFWVLANNGTGSSASLSDSLVTLSSGTANNGSGSLSSIHHARFYFVNPNLFRMANRITSLTVDDCTRRWGGAIFTAGSPLTIDSGFYFSVSPTDVLSVNHKVSGSSAVSIASGLFNGEVDSYTMDTDIHAYEILYYIMGAWFFIDGQLIHKFTPTTTYLTDDNNVHVFSETVNGASGTTSGSIEVLSTSILRLGQPNTQPVCFNINTNGTFVLKRTPGNLHRITVNNFGNANIITIYDNTAASGVILATISSNNEGTFEYNCEFQNGLTITQGGGTPSDITVVLD